MSGVKIASLCTGGGGLDLAVHEFFGADAVTAWCAEFDDGPSAVIADRMPEVPNVRDVKRIPWWIMAPVQVIVAGYPCQPFSLAGARKGAEDERHLWPSIAEGIRIMRPRHVLLENVRGHLSLGFDQVLHDLNALGYAVVWRILAASAVGACHRRERLWIYAQPAEFVVPASSPVLAIAGPDGWLDAEEDLFGGRLPWSEKLPVSGVMHSGEIRSVPMVAPELRADGALFPTPDASVANDGQGPDTWLARRERIRSSKINGNGMGMPLSIAVQLLPTPNTMEHLPARVGEARERQLRRGEGEHASRRSETGNLREDILEVPAALLPTPTAQDSQASGGSGTQHVTLTDAVVRTDLGRRENERLLPTTKAGDADFGLPRTSGRPVAKATSLATRVVYDLLPTPEAKLATAGPDYARSTRSTSGGDDLTTAIALLPTPYAYEGSRGGVQDPEKRREGGHSVALSDVVAFDLLPTPRSSRGASTTEIAYNLGAERSDDERTQGVAVFTRPAEWGKYAAAVERHAMMLGRAPAAPTQPNTKGNPELAPPFVEWMMCMPAGWITDPALWEHLSPRKAREVQLRILGNGVVPIQALYAYRSLAALAAGHREVIAA